VKKILINYAHGGFFQSQKTNAQSALEIGGFSDTIQYRFKDLDENFVKKNYNILSQSRGAGYWLWKPYIILKTLEQMGVNDILLYSDAAIEFTANMKDYFDLCISDEKGLVLFYNNHHLNYIWTKRDCFELMGLGTISPPGDPTPCAAYSRQLNAAIQMCRKTEFSLNFYKEYLKFCEDPRVLTDIPNTMEKENFDGYREHRHDQSIVSLLRFKYNVTAKEDITQWGPFSGFGHQVLLNHHRRRG
tara:strand:- start:13721 stop:14455 length:735 start_codon:yes stop_codon:yes gene_type:complete